jgi:hypothetical protein
MADKKYKGVKYDGGKPEMRLLPFRALDEVSKVLTYGAKKYRPDNWKYVDNAVERYESAMLRHISAYMQGEESDPESGLSHLGHAACCILFLIWFKSNKRTTEKSNG